MPKSRDNHYVPEWHQRLFIEPGSEQLAYLDLTPRQYENSAGQTFSGRSEYRSYPSQCFMQTDLYSTFFGASVNDEVERKLFGPIDAQGSKAVRAFLETDQREWHRNFQHLFDYIDIQKSRTPKGLDWLKAQYPSLTQNELMWEMQGIRSLNCTIWTEGIREIVSAESSQVKFILTDHPVTVYNHSLSPIAAQLTYPNDAAVALKASQTLFPLSRDFCLVLTNLEYGQNPKCNPLEKRTFARNYGHSLVNTVNFIRTRQLADTDVIGINYIMKSRARRYIAAGRREWLYPEKEMAGSWRDAASILLPPEDELHQFGGEIYAKYDSGHVHYQDAYGRTEAIREGLLKTVPDNLKNSDVCGCGSGSAFNDCCKHRPVDLRPTWKELSIRERNCILLKGITDIIWTDGKDWTDVRRDLTPDQIHDVYQLFAALWPTETDIMSLLPKPDGRPRAVYTGSLHPNFISDFAIGASLYFGEVLIENPFVHPGNLKKEFNPLNNPADFEQEFLKSLLLFVQVMPLVEVGAVNLFPNPGIFNQHLFRQTMEMARERSHGLKSNQRDEPRLRQIVESDIKRHHLLMPNEAMEANLRQRFTDIDKDEMAAVLVAIERKREDDALAPLSNTFWSKQRRGQFEVMKLVPNFEMAMFVAQATGSSIVTDSNYRWREINSAIRPRLSVRVANLKELAVAIEEQTFWFPANSFDVARIAFEQPVSPTASLLGSSFEYLRKLAPQSRKQNWEKHAAARFKKSHSREQKRLRVAAPLGSERRIACAFPAGGIQDNHINRLLLMSSSDHHLDSVPAAYFMESITEPTTQAADGSAIFKDFRQQ